MVGCWGVVGGGVVRLGAAVVGAAAGGAGRRRGASTVTCGKSVGDSPGAGTGVPGAVSDGCEDGAGGCGCGAGACGCGACGVGSGVVCGVSGAGGVCANVAPTRVSRTNAELLNRNTRLERTDMTRPERPFDERLMSFTVIAAAAPRTAPGRALARASASRRQIDVR
jgi:hypothetical protein